MASKSDMYRKLRTWREEPAKFVWDNFGAEPDAWQKKALEYTGGDYEEQRRLSMKAATGVGKSSVLAWIGWHRLACFASKGEHPKGAALAITKDNLSDNLWSELSKWHKRSPFLTQAFTWTKSSIYQNDNPETWFLSARSFAKDADSEAIGRALSGLHSKYPFILLDETGDMPTAVGRAAEQIFTGNPTDALIAGAGNPTSTDGLLYEMSNKLREIWKIITITSDPDDPDRSPRVSIELAKQQIKLYGRDNPWIMATILGLFPPIGFNALLGIEDVEAAMNRHYTEDQYNFAPIILGVDVARMGDDSSVIFPRQGLVAHVPQSMRNVKSYELAGQMSQKYDKMQADGVIVDGTGGYGGGVIDAYEQMGRSCFDCQFAGKASNPKYFNKRAEIWFEMSEWIKAGGALPYLPELIPELTSTTYSFKGDRLIIEPKEEIKKKLGKSPDLADALALTFAFPIQKQSILEAYVDRMQPAEEWNPFADL